MINLMKLKKKMYIYKDISKSVLKSKKGIQTLKSKRTFQLDTIVDLEKLWWFWKK